VSQRLFRLDPRVDEFLHCQPCVATWVGLTLAGIYRLSGWQDGFSLLRREIQPKELQADVERVERVEIERPTLPGISIRS